MNKKSALILLFLLFSHISWASIYIETKEVELGKIIQGMPINYVFSIKNTGTKVLHIKKITPD